jgi:hypothetical protein
LLTDEVLEHYLKIGGCAPSVVGGITIRVTITMTIGRRIGGCAPISQGELMEIPLSGQRYTWSNNQEDPTFELLDRVLVSPAWEENFPLVTVSTLSRELSDHTPLLITTHELQKTRQFSDLKIVGLAGRGLMIWLAKYGGKLIEEKI